jgi:hypothetical protein
MCCEESAQRDFEHLDSDYSTRSHIHQRFHTDLNAGVAKGASVGVFDVVVVAAAPELVGESFEGGTEHPLYSHLHGLPWLLGHQIDLLSMCDQ